MSTRRVRRQPMSPPSAAPDAPPLVDAWLVPPDNPPQRVADKRRQVMRLSALFEEFCQFLRVEREAAPRSIGTYRWCLEISRRLHETTSEERCSSATSPQTCAARTSTTLVAAGSPRARFG